MDYTVKCAKHFRGVVAKNFSWVQLTVDIYDENRASKDEITKTECCELEKASKMKRL